MPGALTTCGSSSHWVTVVTAYAYVYRYRTDPAGRTAHILYRQLGRDLVPHPGRHRRRVYMLPVRRYAHYDRKVTSVTPNGVRDGGPEPEFLPRDRAGRRRPRVRGA